MGFLGVMVGSLISIAIFVAVILVIVKAIKKVVKGVGIPNIGELAKLSQEEKIAFQNMMMTPNDATVSVYIENLKKGAEFSAKNAASQDIGTGMQMKYVNAYKVVKGSPDVSEELKNELGRMFLVNGIAVPME